jgi:hypothetical protein
LDKETELSLIKQGEDASFLLGNDIFNDTINSLVDAAFQQFVNSQPEQTDHRELSYHHYRALVEIVSTLQQRVAVKEQIEAKGLDDNNQEVPDHG